LKNCDQGEYVLLACLDHLREIDLLSTFIRMLLAMICGGMIGIERSCRRRPAGFRTHILICLGAAMTTLTSQYLYTKLSYYTDIARLGAQVVVGIGFIGAGTIMVTRQRRVKGLTTAAGLWSTAIIGLCCGAGFYEGAVCAAVMVMLVEGVFSKFEFRLMNNARQFSVLVGYKDMDAFNNVIRYIRDLDLEINDLEITRRSGEKGENGFASFSLRIHRKIQPDEIVRDLSRVAGILTVEEM